MFVVVGAAFSTIRKINEAVLYILVVEFPCGKILMKFIVCGAVKARWIHDEMMRESCEVADEVLYNF